MTRELHQISILLGQGRTAEAEKLLGALNQICRAFGEPPLEMPHPCVRIPDGVLVTAPVDMPPAEFLRLVRGGVPILDLEAKPLGDGRWGVLAA